MVVVASPAMTGAPRPLTGRCLCGGVTYSVDAEPVWQGVCHCSNCQRQTASAFSAIVGVPSKALTVEGDTLAVVQDRQRGLRQHHGAAVLLNVRVADIQHDRVDAGSGVPEGGHDRRHVLVRTDSRDLDALGAAVGAASGERHAV